MLYFQVFIYSRPSVSHLTHKACRFNGEWRRELRGGTTEADHGSLPVGSSFAFSFRIWSGGFPRPWTASVYTRMQLSCLTLTMRSQTCMCCGSVRSLLRVGEDVLEEDLEYCIGKLRNSYFILKTWFSYFFLGFLFYTSCVIPLMPRRRRSPIRHWVLEKCSILRLIKDLTEQTCETFW